MNFIDFFNKLEENGVLTVLQWPALLTQYMYTDLPGMAMKCGLNLDGIWWKNCSSAKKADWNQYVYILRIGKLSKNIEVPIKSID